MNVQTSVPASDAPNPHAPRSDAPPAPRPRRLFRLFKRADSGHELPASAPGMKDRPYYFKFNFRGHRYTRCLEVTDSETAQKYARAKFKEIRDAVLQGDYARLAGAGLRPPAAGTIQQLLAAYLSAPVDAEAPTRTQNALALQQLLRVAELSTLNSPLSTIDASLARRWFELASARALAAPDQPTKATIKRSANSRYTQAKSLFVPKAIATYKDLGLYHPNFELFSTAGKTFKFAKLPATSFNPPADAIITATLAAWQTIEDRNLFLAIGHELAFGLRVAEWACARWSWWTSREGYPVLDGEITADERVKNGTGLVQVRALDPWFSTMRDRITAKNWREKPEDYIITGTPTNRLDTTPRAVSAWLRALGWQTQKTNHELRKYAGSQIAMRYGIYDAQCWLRHSQITVTQRHYSGYVRTFKPSDLTTLPARWATLSDQPPQLRLLEHA